MLRGMSLPRIEVCDPSSEGNDLRSGLRERELFVVRRDVEDFYRPSEAVAIVLAGDAEGALAALAHMRGQGPVTKIPVILVGHPDAETFGEAQALLLGAHAYFKRPVDLDALASRIKGLLDISRDIAIQTGQIKPITTFVGTVTGRERTQQLSGVEPLPAYVGAAMLEGSAELGVSPVQVARGPVADLSPRLRSLLEEADKRVFPDGPRLEVTFPASDESPDDLVPADLLDHVVNSLDMPEEDALESLTFVGPSPVMISEGTAKSVNTRNRASQFPTDAESNALEFGSSPSRAGESVGSERRMRHAVPELRSVLPLRKTGAEVQSEVDSSLFRDKQTSSLPSEGSFGDVGLMPLILRLSDERASGVLRVNANDAGEIRLLMESGSLRAIGTHAAVRVVESMRVARMWDEAVGTEKECMASLKRRVASNMLSSFELEKSLTRARFEAWCEIVTSTGGEYSWGALTARDADLAAQPRRPFSSDVVTLLVDASRRKLSTARVLELLGDAIVRIAGDRARQKSVFQTLPIEVEAWLYENTPRSLSVLLTEAPAEEGIAGIVYALSVAGVLELEAEPTLDIRNDDAKQRVNEMLERAKELAEDGDYFALLALPRNATTREVREAFEERSRVFRALPLADLGLYRHEATRESLLYILQDAYEVLSNESVRADYASSLFGESDPANATSLPSE